MGKIIEWCICGHSSQRHSGYKDDGHCLDSQCECKAFLNVTVEDIEPEFLDYGEKEASAAKP